jgi:nucleoside-diphosphate-sugar epimerase
LRGEKILIVGPTGNTGPTICRYLADGNEVWALARFSSPEAEQALKDMSVITYRGDLSSGEFPDLPDDFTYVVNLAAFIGPGLDFDYAMRVNAEGPGLIMQHCRKVKAFLQVSTGGVYATDPDPWRLKDEAFPTAPTYFPFSPSYGYSKLAGEGVVRTMARVLGLPTTIARLNAGYDASGGLPAYQLDWIRSGLPVPHPADDVVYTPLHHEDMARQVELMLAVASVPATITNWCGDETVSIRQWCDYFGEILGRPIEYIEGAPHQSSGMDSTRRRQLVGPCHLDWRTGMRRLVDERPAGLDPRAAQVRTLFLPA